MLTLLGPNSATRHCDGISRRDFVRIGALGLGGLTLPQLLALEQAQANDSRQPAARRRQAAQVADHDLPLRRAAASGHVRHQGRCSRPKSAASSTRFRPPCRASKSASCCRTWPACMDKLVPIRTVVGCRDDHAGYQCFTGHLSQNAPAGGWPHIGSSVVAAARAGAGRHSAVCQPVLRHAAQAVQRAERRLSGPGAQRLPADGRRPRRPRAARHHGRSPGRPPAVALVGRSVPPPVGRQPHDGRPRHVHAAGDGHPHVVASCSTPSTSRKEDQKTRDRYGYYDPSKPKGDGAPRVPQNLLLARRLVEAGVRVVTVNYSFWDWHGQNFKNAKEELPIFDKAVSRAGRRPARARPGRRLHGRRLGRIRPHAEDQQGRRPRSLAARVVRAAGRRRHENGPGHRPDRPPRRRAGPSGPSPSKKSTPRSITTSASTSPPPRASSTSAAGRSTWSIPA